MRNKFIITALFFVSVLAGVQSLYSSAPIEVKKSNFELLGPIAKMGGRYKVEAFHEDYPSLCCGYIEYIIPPDATDTRPVALDMLVVKVESLRNNGIGTALVNRMLQDVAFKTQGKKDIAFTVVKAGARPIAELVGFYTKRGAITKRRKLGLTQQAMLFPKEFIQKQFLSTNSAATPSSLIQAKDSCGK